ncbi:MAG: transporter substrate-binding domain-containing protein [Silvanigrellaceae bacterium]|nr:transporter substrate-binding domain-containing protein [Silvanigrellaceae bacterium]
MKFFSIKIRIKLFIMLFALYGKSIFANSNNINCNKKFKISLYDFGLFYSKETDSGIDKDIALELENRSKCSFDFITNSPRIQALKLLESGNIDISMSSIETPERDEYTYFYHYQQSKNFIIIRKNITAKNWNDFISNPNLKFGIVKGYRHGVSDEKIIYLKKQNRVIEYFDSFKLYKALKENEIQAVLGLVPVYKFYIMKEKGLENMVKEIDWNPNEKAVKNGIMMSKKVFTKEESEKWGKILQNMVQDGTIYKIFRKYLNKNEANEMLLK